MSAGAAEQVLTLLRGARQTLGTAESLTGGLVAAALTDEPGASAVLRGGVVSYAVEVKSTLLGVPEELIAEHGAVSRQCAEAMASGALRVLGCDWAVATTGVAGPDPSEGKAVGTVHVAVAGRSGRGEQTMAHRALSLHGSRREIREATAGAALGLLRDTTTRTLSPDGGTVGTYVDPEGPEEKEG